MEKYLSIENLFKNAEEENMKVCEYVLVDQAKMLGASTEEIYDRMKSQYQVMCESIEEGIKDKNILQIESGEDAKNYKDYVSTGKSILGDRLGLIAARALAVAELNASMGRIVATPTAGSSGILPSCLVSIKEFYNLSDRSIVMALFTAAGIGMVFANVSGIAGATGGCQAECGVAQAMASASIVELFNGDYEQMKNAIAISIKSIEGLTCDPVAGLVECPCIKRNASGAINAVLAADMALSGIKSAIPVDEVILAMKQVGNIMDERLRETATGGLATTKTGEMYRQKIFGV